MNAKPIVALGGKTSQGTSIVAAAELAAFNAYKEECAACLVKHGGAINSPEAAHDSRTIWAKYYPESKKVMRLLKLSFDE